MKSFIVADNRSDLLATLEPILKHWGYRVLSTRKAHDVMTFVQESAPCLLIIGEGLLSDQHLALDAATTEKINSGELPLIALKQEATGPVNLTPTATLAPPLDLFDLFAFIQRNVEKHPRQNLRLRMMLPGMYSTQGQNFILAEVLSLSMNGLFFKAPAQLKKDDRITVVVPLLGQGKEIEVEATVLYTVTPDTKNNYMQGFGVSFNDIPKHHQESLQHFVKERFLNEVSAHQNGVGDFNLEQLKKG